MAWSYEKEQEFYRKNQGNATTGTAIKQGTTISGGSVNSGSKSTGSNAYTPPKTYNPSSNSSSSSSGGSSSNNGLWYQEDYDRVGQTAPSGTQSNQGSYDSNANYVPPKPQLPINPYTGTSDGYGTEWMTGEDYYQQRKAEAEKGGSNFIGVGTARNSPYINMNSTRDAERLGYAEYLRGQQGTGRDYGANGSDVRPDPYINPTLRPEDMVTRTNNWQMQDELALIEKAEREARRAGEIATENAVRQLEGNRDKINQMTEQQAQDEYVRMMLGGRNLNEAMAASGINGGAAESTLLEHQANYQNNASRIKQEQANALNGLDRDIATMRANGDLQGAQIASEYQLRMAEAAARGNERLFAQLNELRQMEMQQQQYNRAYEQQQFDNQFRQQSYYDDLNRYNQEWNYNVGRDNIMDNRYNQEWELSKRMEDLQYKQEQARLASLLAKSAGTSSRTTNGTSSRSGSDSTIFNNTAPTSGVGAQSIMRNPVATSGTTPIGALNELERRWYNGQRLY